MLAVLLACSDPAPPPPTEPVTLGAITLRVPEGSIDSRSGDQVVLREDASSRREHGLMGGMRAPWMLRLEVTPERPALPCAEPSRLDARTVSCGLVETGGGSGGVMFEHHGHVALRDGTYLRFALSDQADWPDTPHESVLALVLGSVPQPKPTGR